MSGQLLHMKHGDPPPANHVHVSWQLSDGTSLHFRDPRRFGGIWCFPDIGSLRETRWSSLGPDALTLTTAELRGALGTSARTIKAALLDQRAVAGIGNIYADESLHRARINPHRACSTLTPGEWRTLAGSIRAILARAVERGGSTLRDYVNADSTPGGFQAEHRVYGRGGKPCTACRTELVRSIIAQRSTCHCPICQPDQGS
jgi:formamidopyrimidine-DNA glycosylase